MDPVRGTLIRADDLVRLGAPRGAFPTCSLTRGCRADAGAAFKTAHGSYRATVSHLRGTSPSGAHQWVAGVYLVDQYIGATSNGGILRHEDRL